MRAVAEFRSPEVAPPWKKFEGVRLADLSSDDLRDLHQQSRGVSVRQVVEREFRSRARAARRQAERRVRRPCVFA